MNEYFVSVLFPCDVSTNHPLSRSAVENVDKFEGSKRASFPLAFKERIEIVYSDQAVE